MSSLIKYVRNAESSGRSLSFRRAHVDGMPFRGTTPLLREEEFDEYTEVVNDGNVELFDLSVPEDKARLTDVVDRAANGWYSIFRMTERFVNQPDGSVKVFVYCVWSAPHRELAEHRLPAGLSSGR